MAIQRIAVIGATGMLGRPVTTQLLKAGYDVSIIARKPGKVSGFPKAELVRGDVFDPGPIREALRGQHAVYLNLSVKPEEKQIDLHTETDGLRNVVEAAQANGLRRIALISSLVMNYQGQNGFRWWVFDLKKEAISILKAGGVPWTIFYASSFMENFLHDQKKGDKIMLSGTSKHRMHYIAGSDYGSQVARAFALLGDENREYAIQGPQALNADEAAAVFVANYTKDKLRVSKAPMPLLQAMGMFDQKVEYASKIIHALNNYPEQFQAHRAWKELGKPPTSLAEFAKNA